MIYKITFILDSLWLYVTKQDLKILLSSYSSPTHWESKQYEINYTYYIMQNMSLYQLYSKIEKQSEKIMF